ncbi:MAG: SDR family NAD(P)-dependent oxidoreductase [Candidatus Ancaeobacter aquaticus]|nr:SDR family NAD(P)-dependent oxidoreductase [Candidatus Ancaeobacter aquaticus]
MKTALVTGGAGFIGSHLAEELLLKGFKVKIIDNLSTGSLRNIKKIKTEKNCTFIRGDIMDEKLMKKVSRNVDIIFHLAAAVGVKYIIDNPLKSMITNVRGTEIALDCADKNNALFVLASTSEVYGKNEKVFFSEDDDRIEGSTNISRWSYACAKALDEFMTFAYHREKKLKTIILRLFNTCGPRQSGRYGMVIPRFVTQALSNETITVYGDGRQRRCFAYVGDVVNGIMKLVKSKDAIGKVFNIGTEEDKSIIELAKKIKELTKSKSHIKLIPYNEAYKMGFEDMRYRRPDLTRIYTAVGYESKTNLEQLILKVIDYYKK